MRKLKGILSTILLLSIVITTVFIKEVDATSVYGNSNSNISNGGYSASKANYTYIRSSNTYKEMKNSNYYYIYRTYKNGSTKKQIVNNAAQEPYINVTEKYIYYVGVYNSGNSYGIYRVNSDGTGKTRLISNYDCNPIIVKSNYLYYIKETENNNYEDVVSLYCYNLSTKKNISKLYTTTTAYISDISLSGDYIYILTNGYDNSTIYKINSKTKSKTTLYKYKSGKENSSMEEMIYYKGNIYYTVYNYKDDYNEDDDTCEIYKVSTNGKNNKCISKKFTNNISLYNDKIYYINENSNICSMNLDGSSRKTIIKANQNQLNYSLNISNSRIYFGRVTYDKYDIFEGILSDNVYRSTLKGVSITKI